MKCIILAALIAVSLITLFSSFVPEQDRPPESTGPIMQDYLSKLPLSPNMPATSNEPAYPISTPAPSIVRPFPVTIDLGNVSDLSFIYEGRKLAYVQFYSKDNDRVMRIPYEDYQKLASTGKIMSYDIFAPGDHGQAVHESGYRNWLQGKTSGLNKYVASAREVANMLRDSTQSMINTVRTDVVPAADRKIVTPLRDYTQGMINKVRIVIT